ncbi:MAG: flippase-like domain-containing protein, partial [Candidatus Aenigmarchaeota archaeon]|nr:flippase-like domain-containing protein [Candidatus Aenigmarchaeota archaeon]
TNLSLFNLFRLNAIGLVWNCVLPTNVGGDAVRIYKVMEKNPEIKHRVFISTVADRAVSISALFFLFLISLPFNGFIEEKIRLMLFSVFVVGMIMVFVFFRMNYSGVLIRRFFGIIGRRKWYSMFEESKSKIFANPKILFFGFIFSMFIHVVSIFNHYLMFQVIEVSVPFVFLFSVIPFVNIILLIPLSLGGLGLRELSFITLLSLVGVSSSQVVSYSILGYCNILFLVVFYMVFLVFKNRKMQT